MAHGHAGFDVDWGNLNNPGSEFYNPAFANQGMQNPAGHRRNMHNGDFSEAGIGVVNGTNGSVGPQIVTQDLGDPGDVRYVTGVVYEDLNSNSFYDIGEGRSGVRIDVEGSAFYAAEQHVGRLFGAGGGGWYVLMSCFPAAASRSFMTTANVVNGRNVKVDYLASIINMLAGDFNEDGAVDAADYVVWRKTGGSQDEYNTWRTNFGRTAGGGGSAASLASQSPVPEPSAASLLRAGDHEPGIRGCGASAATQLSDLFAPFRAQTCYTEGMEQKRRDPLPFLGWSTKATLVCRSRCNGVVQR